MRVRLLKDITDGTGIKVSVRPTRRPAAIAWVKDEVLEMSEASGKKYVDAGLGVEVKDEPASQTPTEPGGTKGELHDAAPKKKGR